MNNIPNAMREAAIKAAAKVSKDHPFAVDLTRSKNGYDKAFEGKGKTTPATVYHTH